MTPQRNRRSGFVPSAHQGEALSGRVPIPALLGIPEERSWPKGAFLHDLGAASGPWPSNSLLLPDFIHSLPYPIPAPSSPPASHEDSQSSYHSARASSAYSSRYYSANLSSADSDFVSARSVVDSVSLPLATSRIPERVGTSEYGKIVRERGLLLPEEAELNWSGREAGMGQHVEFELDDPIPLKTLYPIGFSLTAKVEKVQCKRILLARKSMKCSHKLTLGEAINEVEHLHKLRHAHIIQLIGSYVQGKTFAILLYPVADCDLSVFMDRVTKALASDSMNIQDYLATISLGRFFHCLLQALHFIHGNTTKHMDIKPANILVKEHQRYMCCYQVYIADFGISRSFSQLDHSQTDSRIARSPTYCAPEVHEEAKWGRSADIFSVGCVLLEMYSVLCRQTLDEFVDYRRRDGEDDSFHANLSRVSEWVASCRETKPYLDPLDQGLRLPQVGGDIDIAVVILSMINPDPEKRPKAFQLVERFDANSCCRLGPESIADGEVVKPSNHNCDTGPCEIHLGENDRLVDPIGRRCLTTPTYYYAIRTAAMNGHTEIVQLLLGGLPTDSSRKGGWEQTALLYAASYGREATVRLLVERGANVNTKDDWGHMALHAAARGGREELVELLVEKGADVDARDGRRNTAPRWAAGYRHEGMVGMLAEEGANVNAPSETGLTVLARAAMSGHDKVVELLIGKGADINAKDRGGNTALCWAAGLGHEKVIELLVGRGADVNTRGKGGSTSLHWAASGGHEKVVELLVKKGAEINIENESGGAAMHWAAGYGQENIAKLLIEEGADVNAKGKDGGTVLHWAADRGLENTVELLIEKGADVNAKCKDGDTVLHWVADRGHENIVKLLIEKGADANAKGKDGDTVLHRAAGLGHKNAVELLIEKGADVNAKGKDGDTVLHRAAGLGHKNTVELLIEKGADVNVKGKDGYTVLHWMAGCGRENMVELLIEKGADANAKGEGGRTVLHWAAGHGHGNIVELLIEEGADVNAKCKNGDAVLHWAAGRGHGNTVELLIEKGADVNAKDENGDTVLHWAAGYGHENTVELLIKKGANVNRRNESGYSALHLAAAKGHRRAVGKLLKSGADINSKNLEGESVLSLLEKRRQQTFGLLFSWAK